MFRTTPRPTRVALVALSLGACSSVGDGAAPSDSWDLGLIQQESGTQALLQAVSPVDDFVVWVSGHDATYAKTVDGGLTWEARIVPDADGLQFRDVAAFDASVAYLMSAGEGERSRIYRTDDGGASWRLQYAADHPQAFLDCMDFWSPTEGLVYGDAVDGVPFLLVTRNGGETWSRVPADVLPASLEGEGGFAASGTCLITRSAGRAYVAMGNAERPRVLITGDFGATWSVVDVPMAGGAASGLATIQVGSDGVGLALGGVIGQDTLRSDNVVLTADAGRNWEVGGRLAMAGPVYGSAIATELAKGPVVVAVGPGGLDLSVDGGRTWRSQDTLTYWAVAFSSPASGWAVGPAGRIAKLSLILR